jgi:hypothetical protein
VEHQMLGGRLAGSVAASRGGLSIHYEGS